MDINQVFMTGNLVRDPEGRCVGTDKQFATFTIAVNTRSAKANDNKPEFFSCVANGVTADYVMKYLRKGSSVGIIGRLYTSKYTTKSGEQRVTCNISISQLKSYYNKEADETSIEGSNKISKPPYLGDEKEADPDHKNDLDEVEDDDLPF